MKKFSIGFASDAFLIIQYEDQKMVEEIFYKGDGYLSSKKFKVKTDAPPILTFEFNRSASSWNKRSPIKLTIREETLSRYSTEIGNNIVLGIQGYERNLDEGQPIS